MFVFLLKQVLQEVIIADGSIKVRVAKRLRGAESAKPSQYLCPRYFSNMQHARVHFQYRLLR